MLNILILSYNFPPDGGPAVQRIAKFVKYLSKLNTSCFILTSKNKSKITDLSLNEDVVSSHILRTTDLGVLFRGVLKKIFWRFFIPDKANLWTYTAVKKGIDLVKGNDIDLILSTSPPHSVHLAAVKIAKATGTKCIIDFRDEWSGNPTFSSGKLLKHQIEMERRILSYSDHIITVTESAKNRFSNKITEDKISVIPNGYDEEDFIGIKDSMPSEEIKCRIAYSGRLNKLHSPINLFKALSSLKGERKISDENLEINIFGSSENKKWIKGFSEIDDIVKFHSYLPHKELLVELSRADVLLLLATNMNNNEFIPAKVFEYFRLNRRIFALISHKGELWNMLSNYENSTICHENDLGKIMDGILQLISDFNENKLYKKIDNDFVLSFGREEQTQKLYSIIKNVTGKNNE